MFKKILLCFVVFFAMFNFAQAAVEVNSADISALESVRGIGPKKAQAIFEERKQNGPFKDATDLANRVKGIGPKSVVKLQNNGLTINGKSESPATTTEAKTTKKSKSKKESTKQESSK